MMYGQLLDWVGFVASAKSFLNNVFLSGALVGMLATSDPTSCPRHQLVPWS